LVVLILQQIMVMKRIDTSTSRPREGMANGKRFSAGSVSICANPRPALLSMTSHWPGCAMPLDHMKSGRTRKAAAGME
jgi:hypothetical protein